MTDVWRIGILIAGGADLALLAVAYCMHRRWWTVNDMNVWWLLVGWTSFGVSASARALYREDPPGVLTVVLTGLVLLTGWVAVRLVKGRQAGQGTQPHPRP